MLDFRGYLLTTLLFEASSASREIPVVFGQNEGSCGFVFQIKRGMGPRTFSRKQLEEQGSSRKHIFLGWYYDDFLFWKW